MTKTTMLPGLIFVGMSIGSSACGPIVPLNPTWKDDVRPLVVARCVRCHDNPRHVDPDAVVTTMPLSSFNEPPDVVLAPVPPAGLALLRVQGPMRLHATGPTHMPPAPAAALEDWQIEMLEAWASTDPPR